MPINKATIMTRGTTLGHVSISRTLCWVSVVEDFANNAICCNYVNAYCSMWNIHEQSLGRLAGHLFSVIESFLPSILNKIAYANVIAHIYKERNISMFDSAAVKIAPNSENLKNV